MAALPRLKITRGSLSRRARQVRSPPVAAALRQPILKVARRQTCRLLPIAHQRPVLIRSNARFPLGIASRAVTDSSMRGADRMETQPAAAYGTCEKAEAVTNRQLDCITFLMSRRGGAILLE